MRNGSNAASLGVTSSGTKARCISLIALRRYMTVTALLQR